MSWVPEPVHTVLHALEVPLLLYVAANAAKDLASLLARTGKRLRSN